MPKYFDYFPQMIYNGKKVVDITRKAQIIDSVKKDITVLKPYTVNDGERPEDIAYYYYGTMDYFWIILMTNHITNYYEEWVMDAQIFEKYLIKKYAVQSGNKNGYDVIAWTMNQTIMDNILYFHDNEGNVVSTDTVIINHVPEYDWHYRKTTNGRKYLMSTYINNIPQLTPFRIYDYEYGQNEERRNIYLIDKDYVSKVVLDFENTIGK